MNTSDAPYALTKRSLVVYGDVGATFEVNITRTGDSHTYDFTAGDFTSPNTNSGTKTIASNGQHSQLITLPTVVADVTYTVTITEKPPTADNISQTNPFTINRRGFKTVTVNATSSNRGNFQSKVITYTNYAGATINHAGGANAINGQSGTENNTNNSAEFNFNIVIDDDQAFQFSGSNALSNSITLTTSHFSTSGNADISSGTTTATRAADGSGNSNQLLTIAGSDWYNWEHGTSNSVITFNIDQFCDPGSGGSNVLNTGSLVFKDITGGVETLLYPQGYILNITGRTSGSTSVVFQFSDVTLDGGEVPSFVDNQGDVTVTGEVRSTSDAKFKANGVTVTTSGYTATVDTSNSSEPAVTADFTITVANFTPAITSGDDLFLDVGFTFTNVLQ